MQVLSAATLRRWPLPECGEETDKESRGHVLVLAGSVEIPGAAMLAATAALRAGAGKLTIACPASIAPGLALAVPEARVIGLPETRAGGLARGGWRALEALAPRLRAVVIGPGLQDEARSCALVHAAMPLFAHAAVVLDAAAMAVVHRKPAFAFDQPVVLTPHAGEMAHLLGMAKQQIIDAPQAIAHQAAQRWNACVLLKGATSWIAAPDGASWRHDGGAPGLATSGSGDTLAGIIGGLAARGLPLLQASGWGVVLHAQAGARLAAEIGPLGFLAREIPAQVPGLIDTLCKPGSRG